jgi:hypothetical protein
MERPQDFEEWIKEFHAYIHQKHRRIDKDILNYINDFIQACVEFYNQSMKYTEEMEMDTDQLMYNYLRQAELIVRLKAFICMFTLWNSGRSWALNAMRELNIEEDFKKNDPDFYIKVKNLFKYAEN